MAIEVEGLEKSYRAVRAVDGISLSVPDGQLFAFLGANGAGKSTTIGCLTTLLTADAGRIHVAGHDVRTDAEAVRAAIGVVFQRSLLDDALTVHENLALRATLSHVSKTRFAERIAELGQLIELDEFLSRPYGRLSGGQRRRADIARALLHEPSILFLDEPTAGLDPASRVAVWSAIDRLRRERGLTVFLTTHYMEETEEADRVSIIDAGRIVAEGTPTELRARHSRSILTVTTAEPERLLSAGVTDADAIQRDGSVVSIAVADAAQARRILVDHGDAVRDFEFRHGRMDDVFLALTGHRGAAEDVA
ncbi:ABC transporter ATP-binding protein [Microbacterium sp. EYE_5]|uniref:ABC transporter ATP-binding protein n=1 Tax=unclassified Microbacterium TaxID=2609290 RepID=UPI0020062EFD|nr:MULTISPECIES: ABC transporter ATP-binding protein [unclassified Microbacterium]MCK6081862.1 ABC transporter ATP-binding protein [Microbacterium sp. EYE_382]MCK6087132.1 ABC transporter ATP-binding protein [Microbacterium sp. EYE_384]MCK6124890.1 ABC transporter ATP-binding protein [Microbacterium sp. EYE_80]MCK6127895.1 ABC transporter ATP-binding protein [Microbacterium sp. EYE_79]MCK6142816.1 ABC transporter ATP-binding protein [Microbacterium sp. EYE_39]